MMVAGEIDKSQMTGVVNPLPQGPFKFQIKLYAIADFHIWIITFALIAACNWWMWAVISRTRMHMPWGISIGGCVGLIVAVGSWYWKARTNEIDPENFKYKVVEHRDFSKVSI